MHIDSEVDGEARLGFEITLRVWFALCSTTDRMLRDIIELQLSGPGAEPKRSLKVLPIAISTDVHFCDFFSGLDLLNSLLSSHSSSTYLADCRIEDSYT